MNGLRRMATQLVPLQDVERLSASVIRILGGNPGKVWTLRLCTCLLARPQHEEILTMISSLFKVT